jgi:agmatinase
MPKTIKPDQTFLNAEFASKTSSLSDIGILGIPHSEDYPAPFASICSAAPGAIRAQSGQFLDGWQHWDFDLNGEVLDGHALKIVDYGDVAELSPGGMEESISTMVRSTRLPVFLGGNHAATCQTLKAYSGSGPFHVVQIDAHIDWRDERFGKREGYSSPMRRASELAEVKSMIQVGMRGTGSARAEEMEAAKRYGSRIVTAREVHRSGSAPIVSLLPKGERVYITIDADGLDPSVMPGVHGPAPGGLSYYQVADLLVALVERNKVIGVDFVEYAAEKDVNGITAITAGRLLINVIGAFARHAS